MVSVLSEALPLALALESQRTFGDAAKLLDASLANEPEAPAPLRFKALVLRSDLAVSLNDLGEGRGILAEARQIRLTAEDRTTLAADLRRADDLESFFTHRGCAG